MHFRYMSILHNGRRACPSVTTVARSSTAAVMRDSVMRRLRFRQPPISARSGGARTSLAGVQSAKYGPRASTPSPKERPTKGHAGTCMCVYVLLRYLLLVLPYLEASSKRNTRPLAPAPAMQRRGQLKATPAPAWLLTCAHIWQT